MKEIRCIQCKKLLAKLEGVKQIEIKCPRCKSINKLSENLGHHGLIKTK